MTPYYEQDGITIYHGDCRDVLPTLRDVPLVVTSPPFNKTGHEGKVRKPHQRDAWKRRRFDYGEFDDNMNEQAYQDWQVEIIGLIARSLTEGGSLFYNHKLRIVDFKATHPMTWLAKTDLALAQEIIWDRSSGPNVDPVRFYPHTERIYWLFKGERPRLFNAEAAKFKEIWTLTPDYGNPHPAPFPLTVASRCIVACSELGDMVFDPFMGSGTTLRSAKDLGRRAIGIELEERYCEIAAKRLQQSVLPFDLAS